jgi:hypothetical protein
MSNKPNILRASPEDAAELQLVLREAFYSYILAYGDIESIS